MKKDIRVRERRRVFSPFVWCGFFAVLVVIVAAIAILQNGMTGKIGGKYDSHGLPIIEISLNGVMLEEINDGDKEMKYEGNKVTVFDDGEMRYDDVEIKGRGNGTWVQDKKPYQIKFDKKVDLFEMGKAKKWYLLANRSDGTNLRTEAAFYIEKMLDMKYPYEGKFVELYVDGDYRGLYYLTHAVAVGKNEIDLCNPLGILVELDNVYGHKEQNYLTKNGDLLIIKDLVTEDERQKAIDDFMENYNDFEKAVSEGNYEKTSTLVDIESLAQYYLLSEFSVNPDAYWSSFYFYKDGEDDMIHAGPAWDFDAAFANRRWKNWLGDKLYSPTEKMVRGNEISSKEKYELGKISIEDYETSSKISTIMYDLIKMPEFQEEIERIFEEKMSGRKNELLSVIQSKANEIYDASIANEKLWNNEDGIKILEETFGRNNEKEYEFEWELEVLLDWIGKRYDYFEQEYGRDLRKNRILL